jgi:hypothetical protein
MSSVPEFDAAPSSAEAKSQPRQPQQLQPVQGCLYCHAEGTITYAEPRKIFGLGSSTPTITCSKCNSIALLDLTDDSVEWKIRYKKTNDAPQYYYARVNFGRSEWIDDTDALLISRRAYVQKHRMEQIERGDFDWLAPAPLDPPPPLMSPFEVVYLRLEGVSLQQSGASNGNDETVLDRGQALITDRRLHLLGDRRDWTHRLSEIQVIDYDTKVWKLYIGSNKQFYQGENSAESMDAQLVTAIIRALWKREE